MGKLSNVLNMFKNGLSKSFLREKGTDENEMHQ